MGVSIAYFVYACTSSSSGRRVSRRHLAYLFVISPISLVFYFVSLLVLFAVLLNTFVLTFKLRPASPSLRYLPAAPFVIIVDSCGVSVKYTMAPRKRKNISKEKEKSPPPQNHIVSTRPIN